MYIYIQTNKHWVCHPIFPQECSTISIGALSSLKVGLWYIYVYDSLAVSLLLLRKCIVYLSHDFRYKHLLYCYSVLNHTHYPQELDHTVKLR